MSDEKVGRLFTGTLLTILISHTGAKLAPFNSGGVCQNCPAKTDGALQQIFFPDIKKKGRKTFPDTNQLN
jgi:hypothetical protein